MAKVRRRKPVNEVGMPVEDSLSEHLEESLAGEVVDLAQAFINEITAPGEDLDEPPGSGAEPQRLPCPRCRSRNTIVETSRPWDNGMKVRYMRCRACRMSFKNILATNGHHG